MKPDFAEKSALKLAHRAFRDVRGRSGNFFKGVKPETGPFQMEITIRPATEADLDAILDIVNYYAKQNLMLPRTAEQIRRVLDDFLVAEDDGYVVGCGSNVPLTPRLVELRSLAVAPAYRGTGLGRRLVEALVAKARADGYDQICALTLVESFFSRCGFVTVDRWTISPKIWHECIYCPKFNACDEIAMLMNLREPVGVPQIAEATPSTWHQLPVAAGVK